jgi:NADH-quinone oxidoreductase subunit N
MIGGNLIALAQRNIKRLLAYSSIAHAGYVLVTIAVSNPMGGPGLSSGAFLFYLTAYTLATIGAFAVVIALGSAGEPNMSVDDYAGLWTVRPGLAVAMSVFMLALLGFPIFGGMGFFAKWYIIRAALDVQFPQTRLAIILVLTSVVSAGYYLYVVMVMFMRPRPARATPVAPVGRFTGFVIASTAALLLLFGVWPTPIIRWSRDSSPSHKVAERSIPTALAPPSR